MKKTLSLLLMSIALNVGAAMHPSTDWAATNIMNKTSAEAVVSALELSSSFSQSTNATIITGMFTNYFLNTNVAVVSGAASNDVNGIYYWYPPTARWTNATDQNKWFNRIAGRYSVSNAAGEQYRLTAALTLTSFAAPGQLTNTSPAIGAAPCAKALWGTNIVYITNYATASSSTNPVNDFKSLESFISTLGDDTTAIRGSRQFPFRTFRHASTNLLPDDVLIVDAGSYTPSNVTFPSKVFIKGAGQGATKIYVGSTNATDWALSLDGGGSVSDMTMQTTNHIAENDQQLPLKWLSEAVLNNVIIYGTYDALNNPSSSNSTNRMYNCGLYAAFDAFVMGNATNCFYELYNCTVSSVIGFNGSANSANAHGIVLNSSGGANLKMYGGSIIAMNGSSETYAVQAQTGSTNQASFYNVGITYSSVNGGDVARFTNGGTALVTFNSPYTFTTKTVALGSAFTNTTSGNSTLLLPVSYVAAATGSPILLVSNFTAGLVWWKSMPTAVASTTTNTVDLAGWSSGDRGACWDMSTGTGASVAIVGTPKFVQLQ